MSALSLQYDFSSPFFEAAILPGNPTIRDQGKRYPLWMSVGPDSSAGDVFSIASVKPIDGFTGTDTDASINFSSLAYVASASIELNLGYIPLLTVTLNPPFDEGRKLLDSELMSWGTSILEVRFGYSTGAYGPVSSPPFQGIITQPQISYGTDISISLSAQGSAGYLLQTSGAGGTLSEVKPRLRLIEDIAAEVGVRLDTENSLLTESERRRLSEDDQIVTSSQSKLAVIFELAKKCGCWMYIGADNTFRLLSMRQMLLEKPVATLALFDFPGGIGPGTETLTTPGVYPILSASNEQPGVYLGSYAKALVTSSTDKASKSVVQGEAKPENVTATSKEQVGKKENVDASTTIPGTANDSDVPDVVKKIQDSMQELSLDNGMGIQLEIETIGIPDILPGMVVYVQGLGKRIDSQYSVFTVKHNLSSSGFTTTLTVVQNASAISGAIANKDIIAPQVSNQNTLPPPDGFMSSDDIDTIAAEAVPG